MLLRLPYLAVSTVFSLIRLLPMSDRAKDLEILTLRHQLAVLQRQVGKPQLTWPDRALLAALLHHLPRAQLRKLHLIVSPDTVLRWHRDLLRRRHAKASRPKRPGRPRTVRSIRALVLRLARENPEWGYRRVHGELAALGIKLAASTVWSILKEHGIPPAPDRQHTTWAAFLRSQAEAILAADFFEAKTLSGATLTVLAVIEHATRRVRILGVTAQPVLSPTHTSECCQGALTEAAERTRSARRGAIEWFPQASAHRPAPQAAARRLNRTGGLYSVLCPVIGGTPGAYSPASRRYVMPKPLSSRYFWYLVARSNGLSLMR